MMFSEANGKADINIMPIGGMNMNPVFDEWEVESYAEGLSFFTGIPVEELMPVKGRVWSCLKNDDGSFREIPLD